jgi:hypothetical protein
MSIYQEYSCVYGDLNDAEKDELGKFGADLISAKITNNADKVVELLKEAAGAIDDVDDLDAFLGLVSWLEKEAWLPTKDTVKNVILPIAGVSFAAVPAAVLGARSLSRSIKHGQSLQAIMREHPALKDDPNTSRYFHMIKSFAPDIAANSLVAGNVMDELRKLGPAAVTPARIAELLQLQGRIGDSHARVPDMIASSGKDAIKALQPEKQHTEAELEAQLDKLRKAKNTP